MIYILNNTYIYKEVFAFLCMIEESDEYKKAQKKLNKIKSRLAKDNFIKKMIKKGVYL
jgi:hypothetical protein